eukprot:363299-Chlamydomonas_euryale.AAC.4
MAFALLAPVGGMPCARWNCMSPCCHEGWLKSYQFRMVQAGEPNIAAFAEIWRAWPVQRPGCCHTNPHTCSQHCCVAACVLPKATGAL